jgi:hypothetical protein
MGYSHCEKHDEAATNGCDSCDREELAAMTDYQVIRHIGMYYLNDPALEERLLGIACKMNQKPCAKCKGPLGDKHYSDVPGVGDLCMTCHGEWATAEQR